MNEKLNNIDYESLIEYILYERDRNPNKNWGHVRGWTTIYSYCRWNIDYKELEKNKIYFKVGFKSRDDFIIMVLNWHNGNFERKYLEKFKNKFKNNYLYNFIYGISPIKTHKHDYYFKFSESIDNVGLKYLLKSYQNNPKFLFSNIALGSYYQHNQKLNLAYKFYIGSLNSNKNNPYVLAKLAILYSSLGGEINLLQSEKIMNKVIKLLPNITWVNAWYGETLNMIGKYTDALIYFKKYEKLTIGKHRTFEPFMRKAESFIGLGNFTNARIELNKESEYYLGEGYRFVYNRLDKKLKILGY